MTDSRATSRYVKSLLDLAVEQKAIEPVHADMQLFSKVVDSNRDFKLMLQNPIIRHDKKREILEKLFKGKVHPLTIAIFDIITKKNREPLLAGIAKEFHNAYNEYKGVEKATITTAMPLDDKLRAEFTEMVKKYTTKTSVELVERVDKDMIGGFVLNVGDRQVDASIRNKIKALKVEFSQNPYIKEY
jgi:F-type H+-transporting ATPase subunit delta